MKDAGLELPARQRIAPGLWEVGMDCGLETTSYHGADRFLERLVPRFDPMPMPRWQAVQCVRAAEQAAQTAQRAAWWDAGQTPTGTRAAETLHVEADGVWVQQAAKK